MSAKGGAKVVGPEAPRVDFAEERRRWRERWRPAASMPQPPPKVPPASSSAYWPPEFGNLPHQTPAHRPRLPPGLDGRTGVPGFPPESDPLRDDLGLVGVPGQRPKVGSYAPDETFGPEPTLVPQNSTKIGGVRTWLHLVADPQFPEWLVLSATMDAAPDGIMQRRAVVFGVRVADLKTKDLSDTSFQPKVVSEIGLPPVNDIWHIYAHSCHWIAYSSGDGDPNLGLAQVWREGDNAFRVVETFVLKPGSSLLAEANDICIIPLEDGLAVGVRRAQQAGQLVLLTFHVNPGRRPDEPGYVSQGAQIPSVGGIGPSRLNAGAAGYLRQPWKGPLPGYSGPVVEIFGPNDMASESSIAHWVVTPGFDPSPVHDDVLISAVQYQDGKDYNLAMPTMVSLSQNAGASPFSAGPPSRPTDHRLVTYRAFPVGEAQDGDNGNIHRRLYRGSRLTFEDSATWELLWQQELSVSTGQKPDRGDFSRNRPHSVRWGNDVFTAYASDKTTEGGAFDPEGGCWVVAERIEWS